jgi:hypothetical protein
LDIISVLLDGAVEPVDVSDLFPPESTEVTTPAGGLLPLVNPEVDAAAGAVDLLPLVNPEEPEVLADLEPLEKLLELLEKLLLPPPPPLLLLLLPPLASIKLTPTMSKLITIANHNDFLNIAVSFHFYCLIDCV